MADELKVRRRGLRCGGHRSVPRDAAEEFAATKGGKSKSTVDNYHSAWRQHREPEWADRTCASIRRSEVVVWLHGLTTTKGTEPSDDPRPLGDSTRRLVALTMKQLLDATVEERVLLHNPMKPKDVPTQGPVERRYLSVPEFDRLCAAADELDRAATENGEEVEPRIRMTIETLVRTGVRPGEAFGFQVGDFSPTRGRIRVQRDVDALGRIDTTKTDRHRDVPVGGEFCMDLEDWVEGRTRGEWLLPATADGHVWTSARWRTVWKKLRDAAGIEDNFTTYELRHTAASLAIHAGANAYTVARMLGHSDVSTTLKHYGLLWDEELDAIPARMDEHMREERGRFRARRERAAEKNLGRRKDEPGDAGSGSGVRAV
ncbi:tyrosine-type recombinase/integrase [Corynebacterium provencense]|uniref:tyrosine-type recombinase/integrase n=1 Tax=Corynebacterium provencense TaxID=1737425 RepID=UPI00082C9F04|nr:site-specific integrase [Corynebacterium provencense]